MFTPLIWIMAKPSFTFSSNAIQDNSKSAVIGKTYAAHRCCVSIFCRREQFPLEVSFLWLLCSWQ
jgi:hypothetical protein